MYIIQPFRIAAGFFLLLFVSAWSLRQGHGLFAHHAEAPVIHCDLHHDGASAHFHEGHAFEHECPVCFFAFSPVLPVAAPVLAVPFEQEVYYRAAFKGFSMPGTAAEVVVFLRGPPFFLC